MYRDNIKSDKQKDFRGVANQKVSFGFMPAGSQLAAKDRNETLAALRPAYPGGEPHGKTEDSSFGVQ
jgi:hypothetical protein